MLAGYLRGVIAQRLVRKLCTECKLERPSTEDEISLLQTIKQEAHILFEPQGCSKCEFTGYQGRIAMAEWLVFDEQMDALLNQDKILELRNYAYNKGFSPILHAGLKAISKGLVDINEIERVIDLRKT